MSVYQINEKIIKALAHNDYEWQRKKMIPHPGQKLAEGIENVVYVCPFCESINTIESHGNKIKCNHCLKEGSMDSYGFIKDFKFDNLIDWNQYQIKFSDKLRETNLKATGFLNYMSIVDDLLEPIGRVEIEYKNYKFIFTGALSIEIPIDQITNATMTLRRDFGFVYENKHYLIKLDQSGAALLRIVQDKY